MPKNNSLKLPNFKSILKGGMEQKTQTIIIAVCCCCVVLSLIIFILVLYGANDWSWPEGVAECEDTGDDAYCVVANQLPVAELPTEVTAACQDAVNPKYGTKPYCHCKPEWTGPKCDTPNLGVCTIKELGPGEELISEVIDTAACPAAGCTEGVCKGLAGSGGYKYCETITAARAGGCVPTTSAMTAAAAAGSAATAQATSICSALTDEANCWQATGTTESGATDTEAQDVCEWVEATPATQTSESACASTDLKTAEWTPNILPDLTVTTPTPS